MIVEIDSDFWKYWHAPSLKYQWLWRHIECTSYHTLIGAVKAAFAYAELAAQISSAPFNQKEEPSIPILPHFFSYHLHLVLAPARLLYLVSAPLTVCVEQLFPLFTFLLYTFNIFWFVLLDCQKIMLFVRPIYSLFSFSQLYLE